MIVYISQLKYVDRPRTRVTSIQINTFALLERNKQVRLFSDSIMAPTHSVIDHAINSTQSDRLIFSNILSRFIHDLVYDSSDAMNTLERCRRFFYASSFFSHHLLVWIIAEVHFSH